MLQIVLDSFQSALSLVLIIALGYYLTRRGMFDEKVAALFTSLVMKISMPAMIISNLLTVFDRDKLYSAGRGLLIPFAAMLIAYVVAIGVTRLIKVKTGRKGVFQVMFFASNTIFMGLPVNLALFGEESTPFVLFYYAANTMLFWTIGIYCISRDKTGSKGRVLSADTIKRIFSPPLMAFFSGILLILLGIKLPAFLMDSFKYVGNLTTPLSLLFIGITFSSIKLGDIKIDKDMTALIFGRFVLSPLIVYGLSIAIPIPVLMTKVFIIQSAMPAIAQSAIAAKAYDSDYRYATVMVTVTTALSVLFIPVYMVLMSGL